MSVYTEQDLRRRNVKPKGWYPKRFRDRPSDFVGPMAPDYFNRPFYNSATWIPDYKKGKEYRRKDPYRNQLLFPIDGPFTDPWQDQIDYGTNRRRYNGPLKFG